MADTEAVARQFGRIMGRSRGLAASIHPAATLTRAVNIEKIIEAVRAGQVTTCMLLSARPEEMRADVQAGWRDLTARVGASARCEIRSLDAAGPPRRCDPPWAFGALQIDQSRSEDTHAPPDCDPEDPAPGG
ncbi:hypothetical protein [Rhodobacter capsulatus]|uniref:hypothetical protein n=1 Tax=Rhodobacter capsulatus TaxID=1061 RepID=UPI001469E3D7|nr:hypothetical protein [Rhodobacter capsulatus]